MNGFQGPFRFAVDDEATEVPWDQLSDEVRAELEMNGGHTAENAKLYRFRIAVLEQSRRLEKHHDWKAVSRVCNQVGLKSNSITLLRVLPWRRKSSEASQTDFGFDAGASAEGNLFDMLRFKLNLSSNAKRNASEQRYAIMSAHTRRVAQWIYSRGWPFLDFEKYLEVVVPNDLAVERRLLNVSVKAVRSRNIELTQVGLYDEPVRLPA